MKPFLCEYAFTNPTQQKRAMRKLQSVLGQTRGLSFLLGSLVCVRMKTVLHVVATL